MLLIQTLLFGGKMINRIKYFGETPSSDASLCLFHSLVQHCWILAKHPCKNLNFLWCALKFWILDYLLMYSNYMFVLFVSRWLLLTIFSLVQRIISENGLVIQDLSWSDMVLSHYMNNIWTCVSFVAAFYALSNSSSLLQFCLVVLDIAVFSELTALKILYT